MIDREQVLSVLRKRFPGAPPEEVAAAANGIVGLSQEWQELSDREDEIRAHLSLPCGDACGLAEEARQGVRYRVFRRQDR